MADTLIYLMTVLMDMLLETKIGLVVQEKVYKTEYLMVVLILGALAVWKVDSMVSSLVEKKVS
jgi:hypothetical protein